MPEAHFYLLPEPSLDKKYRTVCRLIAKAYQNHHTLYVHCATLEEVQCLDSLLWTFQDISFIPHAVVSESSAESLTQTSLPVMLGYGQLSVPPQEVLVNLTDEVPEFFGVFERIIEMVLPEEADKEISRAKYKKYQNKQFGLQTHTLSKGV